MYINAVIADFVTVGTWRPVTQSYAGVTDIMARMPDLVLEGMIESGIVEHWYPQQRVRDML